MSAVIPPAPTTAQILAAFAQSLAPLAGPAGVAVAALIPAVEQLYDTLKNSGKRDFTVDELAAIVAEGDVELAKLKAARAAQQS